MEPKDRTTEELCEEITALRKVNEQQQAILDASPAMIFYKDKENRFVRVNDAFAKANGTSRKEMEGRTMWDLYPREDADRHWRDDNDVMASGKPKLRIVEEMKSSRGTAWVQTDKIPYRDNQGEIIGIVGFSLDITDFKKTDEMLLASREYLGRIINAVADPIFVKDREHRWVLINKAFCAFMGRSAEELVGKSDYDFFQKAEADVFWAKDEEVFQSGAENVNEEFFTDAAGLCKRIVTKKTLYKDNSGNDHIVGIIRDITDRKQTEEALKQKIKELEMFQKVSVNRELKMIELKVKLKALEERKK